MNKIRKRILESIKPYIGFSEHKDLIAFCVCNEYLIYTDDTNKEIEPDFEELVVVVEKDWLFNFMRGYEIENPLDYLQNEYTSDDSSVWFDEAVEQGKVVMVDFN